MSGFICRPPVPGEVIRRFSSHDRDEIEYFRILYTNTELDILVMIRATPMRSAGRLYFTQPSVHQLSSLMHPPQCKEFVFVPDGLTPRPDVLATTRELDKKYRRRAQRRSNPRRQRIVRYWKIRPLVRHTNPDDANLMFDSQYRREQVRARALQLAGPNDDITRITQQLNDLLNQYWAEGSKPGALTPYSSRQGGRGKEKKSKRKLGRRNRVTAAGEKGREGFVMKDEDKDVCGFSWRNFYIRGTTIAKAYRKMCREFYSSSAVDASGKTSRTLLPQHMRPTREQFAKWGLQRSPGFESWKKKFSPMELKRIDRLLFGTSNQRITKIGQRGAIDSTTIDVELVAADDRTKRIGQAHRILLVDGMYKYIPGFYMGLNAPGADPVQLAYLHDLTEKSEWLKWLGLDDQDPNNWLQIRFSTLIADNTDARCRAVEKKLHEINTGIKFVGVGRSDLNTDVESSHHMLHRVVDHNLSGTTHGQKKKRGDERADVLARMTLVEAIRETARAIYYWNTVELDIQPTLEMRRELLEKGIKLNRANLTRWEMERGNQAVSAISADEARTTLLLRTSGTFTQKGIRLLRPDTGEKREFIKGIRYVSTHPLIVERIKKAKVGRTRTPATSHDDTFLYNPYQPKGIYYRDLHTGELIPLKAIASDPELLDSCTIPDLLSMMSRDAIRDFDVATSREIAISNLEEAQEKAVREAETKYQQDLAKHEKPPSKSALRKDKTANREKEKATLMFGMPTPPATPSHSSDTDMPSDDEESSDRLQKANPPLKPSSGNHVPDTQAPSARTTSSVISTLLRRKPAQAVSHEYQ